MNIRMYIREDGYPAVKIGDHEVVGTLKVDDGRIWSVRYMLGKVTAEPAEDEPAAPRTVTVITGDKSTHPESFGCLLADPPTFLLATDRTDRRRFFWPPMEDWLTPGPPAER